MELRCHVSPWHPAFGGRDLPLLTKLPPPLTLSLQGTCLWAERHIDRNNYEKRAILERKLLVHPVRRGLPRWLRGKESAEWHRRYGFNLCVGRSPGGGHGTPLRYSYLENPMDRGSWLAIVHRVTKGRAWLKWLSTCDTIENGFLTAFIIPSSLSGLGSLYCIWINLSSYRSASFGHQRSAFCFKYLRAGVKLTRLNLWLHHLWGVQPCIGELTSLFNGIMIITTFLEDVAREIPCVVDAGYSIINRDYYFSIKLTPGTCVTRISWDCKLQLGT